MDRIAHNRTHNASTTRLYRTWYTIKRRCYEDDFAAYRWYGARGIRVCDEWRNSFEVFRDWALANGYRDDLTIERRDHDGDYEPDNCCWATMAEQGANKSNNRPVMRSDGKTYRNIAEAARDVGGTDSAIIWVCQGKRQTHKQYGWRYI